MGTTTFIYITEDINRTLSSTNQSTTYQLSINTVIHYFSISQLIHLENTIYLLVTQKFFVAKNMWQYCKLPHMKYRFMYVYICIDNVLCLNETKQNLISEYWIFNPTFRLRYSYCTQDRFSMKKNMNIFLLTVKMNDQGNVKGVPKTRHTDIFSIPSNIPGMSNGFLVVLSCKSVS